MLSERITDVGGVLLAFASGRIGAYDVGNMRKALWKNERSRAVSAIVALDFGQARASAGHEVGSGLPYSRPRVG